ncbi:MAG: hypothetical protein RQ748_07990 [Elusimicrobiales bacterium]|nr:hypothetical protein [Elusimicrobiales bacterium]
MMTESKKKAYRTLAIWVPAMVLLMVFSTGMIGNLVSDDNDLKREVRLRLLNDHLPDTAGELKDLLEADALESGFKRAAASAGIEIEITELKAAYSLLTETKRSRSGVLKVGFALRAGGEMVAEGPGYYHYEYDKREREWDLEGPADRLRYYLSFLYHD